MKNRIITTSIREIKNSYKRFISLIVISLLGVSVFVGIKMSAPDMIKSLDVYYDNNDVYDIKIISTLGLTNKDIEALNNIDTVKKAYGSYSYDALIKNKEKELVLKVIGITEDVNKIEIINGRKPNNNEVVVEENFLKKEKLKIGDEITFLDSDVFKENKLTIVGTVKSPLYINNGTTSSRGTTKLAAGKIDYYVYINENNFDINYYTESYIIVDNTKDKITNEDEYKKTVKDCIKEINRIKQKQEEDRYYEIYNEAYEEIIKNENEGLEKFDSAKNELDNASYNLKKGKKELDSSNEKLKLAETTLNDTKKSLDAYKDELVKTKETLNIASEEITNAKNKLNEELKKYGLTEYGITTFIKGLEQETIPKEIIINGLSKEIENYDIFVNIINKIYESSNEENFINLIKEKITKEEFLENFKIDYLNYDDINLLISNINELGLKNIVYDYLKNDSVINNVLLKLYSDEESYIKIVIASEFYKLDSNKFYEVLTIINTVDKEEEKYNSGLNEYKKGLEEYNKAYTSYITYYNEYQNGLSNYNNGLVKYNNNLNLYNTKLEEYYNSKRLFELEIDLYKEELNKISKAKWYIYDRLDDVGYSNFINDGHSVTNLSNVFPTIFFIVAILISLISMSRMVEDDRMLIGTLKSLGFNNKHIRKKYILYSSLATILGGTLGSLIGFFILPIFVWNIYKIMYDIPVFSYYYDLTSIILGILIALICICGTTIITIRKVVKEKPSDLLRPKAPVVGKRILLEKISFIWKRISFSNKITIRNISRYKKRVLMTSISIMGCTGLMLAGFGIKDSIVQVPNKQYNEIFKFDEMVYLTGELSLDDINHMLDNEYVENFAPANMVATAKVSEYNINIFVPDSEESLYNVVNLKDVKTGKKLKLENNKIVISDKLAELANKKVGDKITITDINNNKHKLIISGISENYIGHYIFMNKETYEKNFEEFKTNIVYLNIDDIKNEEKLSRELLKNDNVISIVSSNVTINGTKETFKSLDSVVLILIVLSGSLSFVVLYNLSNINISERKREIATLKVLGFTNKEVDNYINKESIILTILGIILGLIFGILLTKVIMKTIEINLLRFIVNINLSSFIITSSLIMIFTIIVNIIIHFSLKKVDMIESLKSVE